MAETRKITIEILTTTQKTDSESRVEQLEKRFEKMLEPKGVPDSPKKKSSAKKYFMHKAMDQSRSLITKAASATINRYFDLSEDYITENTYKNTMVIVNKTRGLATSVIGGAMSGARIGGVWGAVAGAAIGAIGWGGSEYIQNKAALSSYYQSINAASMQTQFQRTRAGLVDNGRGTDN
jgi:hypothetical protein